MALSVFPGVSTVGATVPSSLTVKHWSHVLGAGQSRSVALQPTLGAAGRAQARAAVRSWLAACAAATALDPIGCPLSLSYAERDTQSDVVWTYEPVSDADIHVGVDDTGAVRASGEVSGSYSYDYAYNASYFFNGDGGQDSGDDSGSFSGAVTFHDGKAQFTSGDSVDN